MATQSRHRETRSLRVSNSSQMNAHPHAHSPFETKNKSFLKTGLFLKTILYCLYNIRNKLTLFIINEQFLVAGADALMSINNTQHSSDV